MLLTNCAACAAPLGLSSGKKCGRCSTRYCGPACQKLHWEGGHDKFCKKLKRGGGAEQCNANYRYEEVAAIAIEKCAEDTKGQTCYICTEGAVRRHTANEGLVRMCACRGTSGFVHLSCLVQQAQIVNDDELSNEGAGSKWRRWDECRLCKTAFHGDVSHALGWACWKTYLCRPETDLVRLDALKILAEGMMQSHDYESALHVFQNLLAINKKSFPHAVPPDGLLGVIATCYAHLGQYEKVVDMRRDALETIVDMRGAEDPLSLESTLDLACALGMCAERTGKPHLFSEARSLARETLPVAERVLGPEGGTTLRLTENCAQLVFADKSSSQDDRRAAISSMEGVVRTRRRVYGAAHPTTKDAETTLLSLRGNMGSHPADVAAAFARSAGLEQSLGQLAGRVETGGVDSDLGSVCEAVAAIFREGDAESIREAADAMMPGIREAMEALTQGGA